MKTKLRRQAFLLLGSLLVCAVTRAGAEDVKTIVAPPNVPTPHEQLTAAELDKVVPHRGGGEWAEDWVTTSLSPRVIRRGENAKTATYQECTGYTFLISSMKRPRLVRLENGRLVMLATAWLHEAGKENAILLTSDDEGKTWSPPREVNFYGQLVALGGEKVGVVGGRMPLSMDGGETWSQLDAEVKMPDGKPWWHHGSVAFDGKRIAAVGYHEAKPHGPVSWTAYSVLRFSSDFGRTWGGPIRLPAEWQTSEGSLIFARDGALVVTLRTGPRPALLKATLGSTSSHLIGYNDSWRRLTTARTTDDGKTWTDYQVHFRFGKTHTELLMLPNGHILLTYAARIAELDGRIYRGIEAVISRDHGKTWDWANRYYLFRWDMHQSMHSPQSILLSDGRIMTVFLYHYYSTFGKQLLPAAVGMVDAIFWRAE